MSKPNLPRLPQSFRRPDILPEPTWSRRAGKLWVPPEPSKSERKIPLKSIASFRGAVLDTAANRQVRFESLLEEKVLCLVQAFRKDIRAIHDQVLVTYRDGKGVPHKHYLDYIIDHEDETRTAVTIKPASKVESSRIRWVLGQIRAQHRGTLAHRFVLISSDSVTPDRVATARLILRARRLRNEAAIASIRPLAETLTGAAPISALLSATRNDALGFMAVVNLIDDGILKLTGTTCLTRDSLVQAVASR
ncbi:hypothetical protein MHY87_15290 [Microvirga sp. ACRRW]|jgi:hypothetical protein|uniref:hypothetical protein n=1 Tax=Microvirga sp. ACRRW TaxID=2918205 RepID=UPI001EF6CB92|nr:hypothetical protein [Microvirga sp. ACRRW]MCG7394269.1 hypothetical protein [Microvirga sp. ACRRW]